MTTAVSGVYKTSDFRLGRGSVLPEVQVAYVTAGALNAAGDNAVLINHGYTSSHTFIQNGSAASEGSWSELVGPGKAIDTHRYFVVSSNALGSCFGTTGPASIDSATGKIYGPHFPVVTFEDGVRLQKQLLQGLGVQHPHAVVGVSMGGYQTLQWGVQYPGFMDRLVVALSALKSPFNNPGGADPLRAGLAADPHWNGGFPQAGAMVPFLTRLRMDTLVRYSMKAYLAEQGLDDAQCMQHVSDMAGQWAQSFDPNSLVTLRDASAQFDVTGSCAQIRARLLLVLSTTDELFPASGGPAAIAYLASRGVQASFVELQSKYGHLASGLDWQRWAKPLEDFLT